MPDWSVVICIIILFHIFMKKLHMTTIILFIIFILFLLYNRLAFINIVVKFDALEPFDRQMNVYFKGFKIGRTTKIYPDADYKNTYLNLRLYRGKINLPVNSTVKIRKIKAGSYVDVLYPDNPSLRKLRNNDEIKGFITKDINSLLEGKLSDEDLDVIVDDAASLIESANNAIKSLDGVFIEIKGILQDVRPDIKQVSKNLVITSSNLQKTSEEIKNVAGGNSVKDSFSNIEGTTQNLKVITENIGDITKQIDEITVPLTNSVLCETNETMGNVNDISKGLKKTLEKHFGFGRIIFGRPVSE